MKPTLCWLIPSAAFLVIGAVLIGFYGWNFLSGLCLGMAAILAGMAYDEWEGA